MTTNEMYTLSEFFLYVVVAIIAVGVVALVGMFVLDYLEQYGSRSVRRFVRRLF